MLKLLRKLREDLSFSEKELKELNFVQEGEMTRWDSAAAEKIVKDVRIGEILTELIKEQFKQLDERKMLEDQHFSLYEKFMLDNAGE